MKSKPRKERKRNREKTSQDKGFMKKKSRKVRVPSRKPTESICWIYK